MTEENETGGRLLRFSLDSNKRMTVAAAIIFLTFFLARPSRPIVVSLMAPACYIALVWYLLHGTATGGVLRRAFADGRTRFSLLTVSCLFLLLTGWYLSTYHFVPTWDQIGYWGDTLQFNRALDNSPVHAAGSALVGVNRYDYNRIQTWIMSLPVRLLPSWKGTYFAELALISMPVALLLAAYVVSRVDEARECALVPCFACALLFPTMLYPVLYGYLDEVGVLLLVALLAALTDESLLEGRLRPFLAGLGCFGLMCIRRWFVYADIGLAFVTLVWWALYLARTENRRAEFRRVARAAGFVVLGAIVTAVPFAGFVWRSVMGGYSTAYASWTRFGDYATKLADLIGAFGWGWLVAGIAAYVWLAIHAVRRHGVRFETLAMPPLLVAAVLVAVLAFWQTQDFSPQHRYIFTPFLFAAVAVPLVSALSTAGRHTGKIAGAALPIVSLVGFLCSFGVVPVSASLPVPLPTGSLLMRPFRQGDVEQKEELVAYLDDMTASDDPVYFTCASGNVNQSLVKSVAYSNGLVEPLVDVQRADVDSRDGFNTTFFDCEYVVAATPTQLHMVPENERVVCVLNEGVTDPASMIGSHYEELRSFQMDGDVEVSVYRRTRDYTDDEVRELQAEFDSHYPDLPDLFHDRFDDYLASRAGGND